MSTMYCPKCNGEMGMRDVKCSHCGYDFQPAESESERLGFAYSAFAYVVLALAIVGAILTCAGTLIAGIYWALDSRYRSWDDWLSFAFALFSGLVLLIVLMRVYDMKPRK